jgi:hypothetical protein
VIWVLIMTMYGISRGSVSVAAAPGFDSYESCNVAAKAWITNLPKDAYVSVSAVCARQK